MVDKFQETVVEVVVSQLEEECGMSKIGLIKVVHGGVEVSGVCGAGHDLGGKDCDLGGMGENIVL